MSTCGAGIVPTVQLLSEEFAQMSPTKLEALGFYVNVPTSQKDLSETQKKVSGTS